MGQPIDVKITNKKTGNNKEGSSNIKAQGGSTVYEKNSWRGLDSYGNTETVTFKVGSDTILIDHSLQSISDNCSIEINGKSVYSTEREDDSNLPGSKASVAVIKAFNRAVSDRVLSVVEQDQINNLGKMISEYSKGGLSDAEAKKIIDAAKKISPNAKPLTPSLP